jgi:spermidine synthase
VRQQVPGFLVLIAVVLAAMSVGYWLGGRLADRRPSWVVLCWIPAAAGALIALIPPLGGLLFPRLSAGIMATPVNIIILAFVGVVAVFVPPVLLLAMVSPFMIRLLATADNTGRTAGSLYAISTLGSIAGTLFSTLVTIPLWGTRETLFMVSGVLILLGILGLRRKARAMPLLLALPVAGWLAFGGVIHRDETIVHEEESVYQYLQVQRRSDGSTILIVNEGGAMQSIARVDDALHPASTYYESFLLLPYMIDSFEGLDVLVIGSGAGTIPHWLAVHVRPDIPGLRTDAVEIDGRAAELGYRWFNTERDDARTIISDGRTYIGNTSEMYDIIITDTYSNQIYIPFHLTTVEYFTELRAHLNSGGAVAMNVNALSEDADLVKAIGATLCEVFPLVYIAHVSNDYNFMLIASEYPIQAPSADSMAVWNPVLEETARLFEPVFKTFDPEDGLILTDNRAPVEFLTDMMIFHEAAERAR